jgi:tRNA (mo5U34)-methyltransferase
MWTYPGSRILERFLYVRRDLGINIDYGLIDVPDISATTVGQFDIVLFLGVFYHLREPITIIDRLGAIVRNSLILETYLDLEDVGYPAMRYYPGSEIGFHGDPTNWWGPNRACIESLLEHAGFRESKFTRHPFDSSRGIFLATK